MTELERRLRERATESTGEIDDRIALARHQLEQAHRFRYMVRNDDVHRRPSEVLAAVVERELVLAGTMLRPMIEPRIDELLSHTDRRRPRVAVCARDRVREAGAADQQLPPSAGRGHGPRGCAASPRRVALEELPHDGHGGDRARQADLLLRRPSAPVLRSAGRRGTMCPWRGSSWGSPAASPPTRPASWSGSSCARGTTSRRSSTHGAERFVAAATFWALARKQPPADPYPHLATATPRRRPLTANTLARLAHGLADDLLTETALAHRGAARRRAGDEHRDVGAPGDAGQPRAARRARRRVVGPEEGELAEGLVGVGRMAEPEEIAARVEALLSAAPRAAARAAGACSSPPVGRASRSTRCVSSGTAPPGGWASRSPRRHASAGRESRCSPRTSRSRPPQGVEVVATPTAADLRREALARGDADVVRWRRRSADYRPAEPIDGKRPKDDEPWSRRPRADRGRRAARSARAAGRPGARRVRRRERRGRARAQAGDAATRTSTSSSTTTSAATTSASTAATTRSCSSRATESGVRQGAEAGDRPRDPRRGRAPAGADVTAPRPRRPAGAGRRALAERVVGTSAPRPRAVARHSGCHSSASSRKVTCSSRTCPGVGKTVLAKALARVARPDASSASSSRPTCCRRHHRASTSSTSASGALRVPAGPVFTNLLLADEINRASPKTQSALLEAMQETQVTVDGASFAARAPFLVIATQNPVEYEGTYPLPEAQLDRFLLRMGIGYPRRGRARDPEAAARAPDRRGHRPDHRDPGRAAGHAGRARGRLRRARRSSATSWPSLRPRGWTRGSRWAAPAVEPRPAQARPGRGGPARARLRPARRRAGARRDRPCHRLILAPEARATGVTAEEVVAEALAATPVPVRAPAHPGGRSSAAPAPSPSPSSSRPGCSAHRARRPRLRSRPRGVLARAWAWLVASQPAPSSGSPRRAPRSRASRSGSESRSRPAWLARGSSCGDRRPSRGERGRDRAGGRPRAARRHTFHVGGIGSVRHGLADPFGAEPSSGMFPPAGPCLSGRACPR